MYKITMVLLLLITTFGILVKAMEDSSESVAPQEQPIFKIIAQEEAKQDAEIFGTTPEHEYNKLVKLYQGYENRLKTINNHPIASVMGGINYSMSLNNMKQIIKTKFNDMKKNGLIISPTEFEKIKDNYFYKPFKDLTRIWGVEYLKNKIAESKQLQDRYDVPSYVIVTDDPNLIKMDLFFGNAFFPIPSFLTNGRIYFKKIVGEPIANAWLQFEIGKDSGLGYTDLSDPGNVIQENVTGKRYIVDTEFKSFDFPLPYGLKRLLEYAGKRFGYLHNVSGNSDYEITLDD